MSEEWENIAGLSGYQCSDHGRVRSVDRIVLHGRTGTAMRKGYVLKLQVDRGGYLRHGIKASFGVTPLVHRLVAIAFIPNPENKPQVNHKDGDKQNNNIINLEWTTIRENVQHAYDNNLKHGRGGETSPMAKLKQIDVIKIRALSASGYRSKDIASLFNVSRGHIVDIVAKKKWKELSNANTKS